MIRTIALVLAVWLAAIVPGSAAELEEAVAAAPNAHNAMPMRRRMPLAAKADPRPNYDYA